MSFFVGLDWGGESHAVCVIDANGAPIDRFSATHDRDGLARLVARLKKRGAEMPIAIERPSGLIVDSLVEAGFREHVAGRDHLATL